MVANLFRPFHQQISSKSLHQQQDKVYTATIIMEIVLIQELLFLAGLAAAKSYCKETFQTQKNVALPNEDDLRAIFAYEL